MNKVCLQGVGWSSYLCRYLCVFLISLYVYFSEYCQKKVCAKLVCVFGLVRILFVCEWGTVSVCVLIFRLAHEVWHFGVCCSLHA